MTFIYSFLQKRKMHENQHGIVMVIIAYVLSILLLTLGSDTFYSIRSAAAGLNMITEEETKKEIKEEVLNMQLRKTSALMTETILINPYHLQEEAKSTEIYVNNTSEDLKAIATDVDSDYENVVSLLGKSLENNEYDNLVEKIGDIVPKSSAQTNANVPVAKTTKAEKDDSSIKSLKVEVSSYDSEITVSKDDVKMLERIVQSEAGGEDMVGKILVANVIFNRIVDEDFPDTVEGVIFDKSHGDYQFSPVENGRYWSVDVSDATKKAVQRALKGEDYSEGALYFIARKHTTSSSAKWFDLNLDRLFAHGGHEFYR